MFYIYIIPLKYLFILHRNHFLRLCIRLCVNVFVRSFGLHLSTTMK
jgi:hypothetical protein